MALLDKLKLGNVDKRIYVVVIVLVMTLLLLIVLVSGGNDEELPRAAINAKVTETDDKVIINLDRPASDAEKEDITGYLRQRYGKNTVEINEPVTYDEDDSSSLEFIQQRANNQEPAPEDYQPKPTDIDPPGAYE